MEAEEDLPTFRPFTREELATIDNRIFENKLAKKKKQERRDKNIAVSIFSNLNSSLQKLMLFLVSHLCSVACKKASISDSYELKFLKMARWRLSTSFKILSGIW